jgi:hypothetical protein
VPKLWFQQFVPMAVLLTPRDSGQLFTG